MNRILLLSSLLLIGLLTLSCKNDPASPEPFEDYKHSYVPGNYWEYVIKVYHDGEYTGNDFLERVDVIGEDEFAPDRYGIHVRVVSQLAFSLQDTIDIWYESREDGLYQVASYHQPLPRKSGYPQYDLMPWSKMQSITVDTDTIVADPPYLTYPYPVQLGQEWSETDPDMGWTNEHSFTRYATVESESAAIHSIVMHTDYDVESTTEEEWRTSDVFLSKIGIVREESRFRHESIDPNSPTLFEFVIELVDYHVE